MVILGYFINGHWWIYFVIGYWWLLMVIILMTILLMAIGEYSIVNIGGYFVVSH